MSLSNLLNQKMTCLLASLHYFYGFLHAAWFDIFLPYISDVTLAVRLMDNLIVYIYTLTNPIDYPAVLNMRISCPIM